MDNVGYAGHKGGTKTGRMTNSEAQHTNVDMTQYGARCDECNYLYLHYAGTV